MVIEFDPSIFESAENAHNFTYLLNLCYVDRRYDLFADITQIGQMPVFMSLSNADKFVVEQYYQAIMTTNRPSDYLIVSEDEEGENHVFNLQEAREFFNQPVSIIVENSLNDKPFVVALSDKFVKRGKKIKRHIQLRWIDFENGGGCGNIENFISERLQTFANRTKPPQLYLRCFVLIDSDSTYPGDIKAERIKLQSFLETNAISYHFLSKREMENYLPDEAYSDIPENRELIDVILRLNPFQRDYFDLENGFTKNLSSYPEPAQELYASVGKEDMTLLRKGGIKMNNFKLDFPKLFLSDKVTRDNLQERVAHQVENAIELEVILDKINELI